MNIEPIASNTNAQPLGSGRPVLVVEDNALFAKTLKAVLEEDGFQVTIIDSPNEVTKQVKARQPHIILMDVVLGNASGIKLCQELKASPYTSAIPIILVSGALTDEEFQLQGFEEGADDYLVKPISNVLLLAKIRAVLKRYSSPEELADALEAEGLALDVRSRKVMVNGTTVPLTRKEFDLLTALLRKRGQVVYTTHLYHTVWGYGESAPVDSHTVKVHVSSLRSKLGPELGKKIVNLPGLGYRFDS